MYKSCVMSWRVYAIYGLGPFFVSILFVQSVVWSPVGKVLGTQVELKHAVNLRRRAALHLRYPEV